MCLHVLHVAKHPVPWPLWPETVLRSAVDVAEQLLQVSPRTLEDWRLTRSGPLFRKMGRHVRYELGSVMAWFENLGR